MNQIFQIIYSVSTIVNTYDRIYYIRYLLRNTIRIQFVMHYFRLSLDQQPNTKNSIVEKQTQKKPRKKVELRDFKIGISNLRSVADCWAEVYF